jgi:ABC-type bacteriocin/lantibiotic exporter with double-glycine peptidase domain
MQNDREWGSELYSMTNNKSQTIATSGCGPTSMAMVLNYYIDDEITPLQTAEYALENNYRTYNDGTSWTYFGDVAEEYGLEFLQTASSSEALEWMETKEDPLIICSMGRGLWTRRGHFILLWHVENGVAHINDPASTRETRIKNSYSYMASQCKQFFCFNQVSQNNFKYSLFELFNNSILNYFILQGREVAISPLIQLENVGVSPTPTANEGIISLFKYGEIANLNIS